MTNEELIKALRCEIDCSDCAYFVENGCDEWGMRCDAADALEAAEQRIARLEDDLKTREAEREVMQDTIEICEEAADRYKAQLPKEGEWIEDDTTYCGADLANYKCSLCGKIGGTWRRGLEQDKLPPFCGSCGARMRTVTDCHTLEER